MYLYAYMHVCMHVCVTVYTCTDSVPAQTPLLKFFAELVHNKCQRIAFECSSPNGILLFREASRLLVTYGRRILAGWQQLCVCVCVCVCCIGDVPLTSTWVRIHALT